jgi:hypothetical protein
MLFADRLTLDKPRRTADGFLVIRAKAARTGVYQYDGAEIDPQNEHGLRDAGMVNVLREPKTVFDKKAVHSFIGKPITVDHPSEAVTADNWKDHAGGTIMGAMRDGEHLAFDLLFTDKAAISAVDGGKRELSAGYAAELEFGDFQAADGTKCPARQATVRGNHVAIVDRGRAGSECCITDVAQCSSLPADLFDFLTDGQTYSDGSDDNTSGSTNVVRQSGEFKVATKIILVDGYQVEVTDQAEAAITKLQGKLADADTAHKDLADKLAMANEAVSTKDGEIKALEAKLEDAKISPQQLEKLVADRANLVALAKGIDTNVVTDGKTEVEIRKAVVSAKLGDAAKDLDDAAIAGAFTVLAKDVKVDPVRNALSGGVVTVEDAKSEYEKSRDKQIASLRDAYKAPAANAA